MPPHLHYIEVLVNGQCRERVFVLNFCVMRTVDTALHHTETLCARHTLSLPGKNFLPKKLDMICALSVELTVFEMSQLPLEARGLRDGTRAETRFLLSAKRRVHLNRRGRQFGLLLAAEVCASAVVMLDTPCSEVV